MWLIWDAFAVTASIRRGPNTDRDVAGQEPSYISGHSVGSFQGAASSVSLIDPCRPDSGSASAGRLTMVVAEAAAPWRRPRYGDGTHPETGLRSDMGRTTPVEWAPDLQARIRGSCRTALDGERSQPRRARSTTVRSSIRSVDTDTAPVPIWRRSARDTGVTRAPGMGRHGATRRRVMVAHGSPGRPRLRTWRPAPPWSRRRPRHRRSRRRSPSPSARRSSSEARGDRA